MIEITLKKCPDLDRVVGRNLKSFIGQEVSKAQPRVFGVPQYVSLFEDLSDCLKELETGKVERLLKTPVFEETTVTPAREWLALKIETSRPVESIVLNTTKDAMKTNVSWTGANFEGVADSQNQSSKAGTNLELEHHTLAADTSGNAPPSTLDVLKDLFKTIAMLVRLTCPFNRSMIWHRALFANPVGNQILKWILKDQAGSENAAEYIRNNGFLDHLKICHAVAMAKVG